MDEKNNVIHCYNCGQYFINIGQDSCPFCQYDLSSNDIFNEMLGEDSPFNNFGRT